MDKISLIKERLPALSKLTSPCGLCAHKCSAGRARGERGLCRAGPGPAVFSYSPHHGEEPPLSGRNGSGTIFFTHCNMKCVYCQNHQFSQESDYEEIKASELARRMLQLEKLGCHNINLVSPTHYACRIVEALKMALESGLNIPIVYNTSGYDTIELIKILDGIVDIYLPDMRYAQSAAAEKYSSAVHYAENNRTIIKEMFRQAGKIELDGNGIAKKGVLVRLLILPNDISGTRRTLRFLKNEVSSGIYLSVISQYHPTYLAKNYSQLSRRINEKEYREVLDEVENLGFTNGWIQGFHTDHARFLGTNIRAS